MPLLRSDDKLHYFCHVPKCGGSSVEVYLEARFGPLGFLDRDWLSVPTEDRWSRSSPQHMPASMLQSLFPDGYLASSFTMIRHPANRLISAFNHNRNHSKINPMIGLRRFLKSLARADRSFHEQTDNHFLPASRFVPEGAKVFRLEEQGGPLIDWLDGLAGNSDGPRELPRVNVKSTPPLETEALLINRLIRWFRPKVPTLDRAILEQIRTIYQEDYDRFGYDPFAP